MIRLSKEREVVCADSLFVAHLRRLSVQTEVAHLCLDVECTVYAEHHMITLGLRNVGGSISADHAGFFAAVVIHFPLERRHAVLGFRRPRARSAGEESQIRKIAIRNSEFNFVTFRASMIGPSHHVRRSDVGKTNGERGTVMTPSCPRAACVPVDRSETQRQGCLDTHGEEALYLHRRQNQTCA